MTIAEIRRRIKELRRWERLGDIETLHSEEDKLYYDILEAIAQGAKDPDKMAKEALKSRKIVHTKWYA